MRMSHLVHFGDLATWRIGDDPDAWWTSLRDRIEHLRDDNAEDAWGSSLVAPAHYSQAALAAVRGGWARVLGRSAGGGIIGSTHGPDLLADESVLSCELWSGDPLSIKLAASIVDGVRCWVRGQMPPRRADG